MALMNPREHWHRRATNNLFDTSFETPDSGVARSVWHQKGSFFLMTRSSASSEYTGISICALSLLQNVVLVLICCKQTNFPIRNNVNGLICLPPRMPLYPYNKGNTRQRWLKPLYVLQEIDIFFGSLYVDTLSSLLCSVTRMENCLDVY